MLAGITVLVGGIAFGAGTFDEAVWKEHFVVVAIGLLDFFFGDGAVFFGFDVDLFGKGLVLGAVGGVVMGKFDAEVLEVFEVVFLGFFDEFFGGNVLGFGGDHDGSAVGVICANIVAVMAF